MEQFHLVRGREEERRGKTLLTAPGGKMGTPPAGGRMRWPADI